MVDFTEVVRWDSFQKLRDNLTYGLGRPVLENVSVEREGLTVPLGTKFGRATYQYDFGRSGSVTALTFEGTEFLKFRLKTAAEADGLDLIDYDGTDQDRFSGTIVDPVKYTVTPNVYNVLQNGGIRINGTQTAASIFTDPAKVSLNVPLFDTYTVRSVSRLAIGDPIYDSGALTFLELDNGVNNVQIQKYHAQIRSQIVDAYGNSLGRDVDSNNIILGEPVDVSVNSIVVDDAPQLTDGTFGNIKDTITDPTVVEEFKDLKVVEEIVDFFDRTSLTSDCVRILGIRADYSLTGILADLQEGLFYRPKRVNGYYALRTPVVGVQADLFANKIESLNLVGNQFVYAETNDVWGVTVLVPAGVHYYRFNVDGEPQLDEDNPTIVPLADGDFSSLVVESTRFVEFLFRGRAEEVFLEGTFNNFTPEPMRVGFDPSEILKIDFDNETYYNSHPDWHKVEIEFEQPTPIMGIRFLSGISLELRQRVKIFLDDVPITKDEWEIDCSPEDVSDPGVSECATYSNLLAGTFAPECQSAFVNNTDTITASEDGWVEWHFRTNEPVNNREVRRCRKFALWTRLENGALHQRQHRALELLVPSDYVARVTDYLVSDNELEFRTTRETEVGPDSVWSIPQVVLENGDNVITPTQLADQATYGGLTTVTKNVVRSFIEQIDQSNISLNNVEIACTLAANLTQPINGIIEVLDLGGVASLVPADQRFTRESFTRANDSLRVVVINIDLEPVQVYYLHLVAQPSNFLLEVYATEEDALQRTNRLGFAESSGYGFQTIGTFTAEQQIETIAGLQDITADNIIVCFDEYAADTVFRTKPRANV